MDYGYLSEKLSAARRALMLPHTHGEEDAVDEAFRECMHGFHRQDENDLEESARDWMQTIKRLMEAQRPLSIDQKLELARAVDELAHHADRIYWSTDV